MANFLTGTPSRFKRIDKYEPGQVNIMDTLAQMGLGGLQQNQGGFGPIRERETREFQQQTLPSIAQRLTNMGSQSRGSERAEAFGRAGTDFQTNLAALGSQHALQREGNLLSMLQAGLQPQKEIGYFGGRQGLLGAGGKSILEGLGSSIPIWAKSFFEGGDDDTAKKIGGTGDVTGPKDKGGVDTNLLKNMLTVMFAAGKGGLKGGPTTAAVEGGSKAFELILPMLASYFGGGGQNDYGESIRYEQPNIT